MSWQPAQTSTTVLLPGPSGKSWPGCWALAVVQPKMAVSKVAPAREIGASGVEPAAAVISDAPVFAPLLFVGPAKQVGLKRQHAADEARSKAGHANLLDSRVASSVLLANLR
jgi:hypothetical protein